MNDASRPSDVAAQVAAVLDDNQHVNDPRVLTFELALSDNPTDRDTRQVYRDWLLENGCPTRAGQLEQELQAPDQPYRYAGPVRPEGDYNWVGLCGVNVPRGR